MEPSPELRNNLGIDLALVEKAKGDWKLSQSYFAWAVEPEMVDFAIFWERVARLRYLYLLRRLRAQEYKLSLTELIKFVLEGTR